jgi:microcystin-dependent protein
MADPFVAEIRMFAGNFAPTGWASCDGQLLPISQNTALFSLLGTYYGGDGKSNFGLPNMAGASPMQQGQGPGLSDRFLGETAGTPTVTLLTSEIAAHNHNWGGSFNVGDVPNGGPSVVLTQASSGQPYQTVSNANLTTMNPQAITVAGSSFPHNNMMPFLTVYFIIALQGVFPPRS